MKKRVLVAMSGGVDSSVAAILLKKKNYEVTGVTMCLGVKADDEPRTTGSHGFTTVVRGEKARCCGPQAVEDAKRVCHGLGIPHYVMDFSKDLEERVISKFVSEYLKGRTPNPCIDCNRFLKFELLLGKAVTMGFDFLATGHYARIEKQNGTFVLMRAKDKAKDQSYFLYPIEKEHVKSILFPLALLTKEEVREIARKADLPVADKPQSQDICFITGDYREFVLRRMNNVRPGDIIDADGNIRGAHKGIFHYTIGQRKGMGISDRHPLYVFSKDVEKNQLKIGPKENLQASALIADDLNILVENLPREASAKIRYAHREAKCEIFRQSGELKVIFKEKQEAITPGQSVVLYDDDIVLGGGVIKEVLW